MVKIKQTEDKEYLNEILRQLKENHNHCPCSLITSPDTKCMCKKFRDQVERQEPGECDCGRYELIVTSD
jgi:hypothetical protein